MATHYSILAWRIPLTEEPGPNPWGMGEGTAPGLRLPGFIWWHGETLQLPAHSSSQQGQRRGYGGDGRVLH